MGNTGLISVIMPCYKMGRFIGEALASIGKQSYESWEVIAVDDCGPEDGTREVIESFAGEHKDHRVTYLRHDCNRGVSAARNTAIASATGELLAFLDPDDRWASRHLSAQVSALAAVPHLDLAYTGVQFMDGGGTVIGTFEPSESFLANFPNSLFCSNEIHLSTVVVRAAKVTLVGGFDESPEIQHVEDWDLWIRLALAGATFLHTAVPTVFYRRHPGSASIDDSRMAQRCIRLMHKYRTEMRVTEALYMSRLRLITELRELQAWYDGLRTVYHGTLDHRLKRCVRRFLGRNPPGASAS